jgi:hypothetical protein
MPRRHAAGDAARCAPRWLSAGLSACEQTMSQREDDIRRVATDHPASAVAWILVDSHSQSVNRFTPSM